MSFRADFEWFVSGNCLLVIDLDLGNRSVTNDVENVLEQLEPLIHPRKWSDLKVYYRDSMQSWDEILVDAGGNFEGFRAPDQPREIFQALWDENDGLPGRSGDAA